MRITEGAQSGTLYSKFRHANSFLFLRLETHVAVLALTCVDSVVHVIIVMINGGLLTSSRIRTKGSKVAGIGLAPRNRRRHVELCLRVY